MNGIWGRGDLQITVWVTGFVMINIHILFVALPNEYLKKNLICTSK